MTDLIELIGRAIADADKEDYMEDFQRYDARARAALAGVELADFAVVPKKPTKAMIDAAYEAHDAYEAAPAPAAWCGLRSAYHAMVAAAPKVRP
jgi:hypothetical protein